MNNKTMYKLHLIPDGNIFHKPDLHIKILVKTRLNLSFHITPSCAFPLNDSHLEKLNPINEGDIEWYSNPFFISYKRANLQESK